MQSLLGVTDAPFSVFRRQMNTVRASPPDVLESDRKIAVRGLQKTISEICDLLKDMGSDVVLARIVPFSKEEKFTTGKMKGARLHLHVLVLNEREEKWEEKTISLEDIRQIEIWQEHD